MDFTNFTMNNSQLPIILTVEPHSQYGLSLTSPIDMSNFYTCDITSNGVLSKDSKDERAVNGFQSNIEGIAWSNNFGFNNCVKAGEEAHCNFTQFNHKRSKGVRGAQSQHPEHDSHSGCWALGKKYCGKGVNKTELKCVDI